jgi:ribosomal protein L37AE/L43A
MQLNSPNKNNLKDDEKWFDTTQSLDREEKVTKICVVCYSRGKRSESVWQCKQCGVALHIEECFYVYHNQQSF